MEVQTLSLGKSLGNKGAEIFTGSHRHGYMYRLGDREVSYLKDNGYKLETNGWYTKGDYFEIRSSSNNIIHPIELGRILEKGGV